MDRVRGRVLAMVATNLEPRRRMRWGAGDEFVAFDLETTGLSAQTDRIVEIGAVRFRGDGSLVATFERLVNSGQRSGATARSIHQIDEASLARAAGPRIVLAEFLAFLGDPAGTRLVAHNAAFDVGMLGRELAREGLPLPAHRAIDTLAWSRRVWPDSTSYKLGELAGRLGSEEPRSHRALADSRQVRVLFLALAAASAAADDPPPLAYPIRDGAVTSPIPCGWDGVVGAMLDGSTVQIAYDGGSRGDDPRAITPRQFAHRGGVAYLAAWCHLDRKVKEFQVDKIRSVSTPGDDRFRATAPRAAEQSRLEPGPGGDAWPASS